MKSPSKIGLLTLLTLLLIGASFTFASTQGGDQRYFPETGLTVSGEFLTFYEQHPNPELVYGFPISVPFENEEGLLVQYFQRARFELHPDAPPALRVQLTPLGALLYEPGELYDLRKNPNVCRTFPETGYDVCYDFLEFFDKHGGVAQFGYPISPVEVRGTRLVQYFQRARFEWHPDRIGSGQEVQLSFLGEQYFNRFEDPQWRIPDFLPPILQVVTLQVYAFPAEAVVRPGGSQSAYVIVQDQALNPVENASVTLTLRYPSGLTETIALGQTNELGLTSGTFALPGGEENAGLVEIIASASYDSSLQKETRASFRIAP